MYPGLTRSLEFVLELWTEYIPYTSDEYMYCGGYKFTFTNNELWKKWRMPRGRFEAKQLVLSKHML